MSNMQFIEKYGGKIEDLFSSDEKYTFLVGAGVSMDPPTNMPSARQLVRGLLEFCTPLEEVESLLSLENLRYEMIVELVQGYFDEELKFLDYLDIITEPNLIHFFLSNAIMRDHYVVTTNFDFLIEQALMRIVPENLRFNIYPIITKEDFLSFQIPQNLIQSGKYPIYKIHGAKRNIITGMDTRDSLITTISALGRGREEGTTFAIEPYKKPAVYNLMKDRTLVALGYSGSDDFDIGPMLKELPFLNRIIWIEHSLGDEIEILKFNRVDNLENLQNCTKLEKLLTEIRSSSDFDVILIKTDTGRFIQSNLWNIFFSDILYENLIKKESDVEVPKFQEWIRPIYKDIPILNKYRMANQIYYDLKKIDASVRCSEKGLAISEEKQDISSKSHFLNFFGLVNQIRGEYDKALQSYSVALHIDEQLGDLQSKSSILNNIGSVYLTIGKYDDALENYKKAKSIDEQLGNSIGVSTDLNNIGKVHENRGEYELALKHYQEALHIAEELGSLERKALLHNNIGMIFSASEQYDKALVRYEEALKIAEQLGDLYGKLILINNIGRVYHENGYLDKALQNFEKALNIEKRLGDPLMMAIYLNNIGMIYSARNEHNTALEKYKEALKLVEKLKDNPKIALFLSKIGMSYFTMENYNAALESYIKSVEIFGQLGDLSNKVATLSNIGNIYEKQGNYNEALKIYEENIQIDDQLGDLFGKATDLNNIGRIYETKGEYHKALEKYGETLQIFQQMEQAQYIEMVQKKIDELRSKLKE